MTPLLLLVDMQHDYLRSAGLEPAAGQIVERTAALLEGCRALGIPVVHVWTTVSHDDDRRMPHWKRLDRWMCVEGTEGHATPVQLGPCASEQVVHKTFFSGFSSGTLGPILAARGVDTLLVAGIHLHACVRETVLDGCEHGFEVWVAQDAVGSDDPLHASITRRYLQSRAAQFATVASLLEMQRGGTLPKWESPPQVGEATLRARLAFERWTTTRYAERRESLERLADLVERDAQSLGERMAREIGKPIFFGRTEAERTADLVRAVARQDPVQQADGADVFARRCSVGVIALVTPWNNPLFIPLGKIAAALFFGNTVVWKPAPAADSLAHRVMEYLREAGFAQGVVNLICGDHHCAESLMSDAQVDAVSLTGASLAGYCVQEICGRRRIPLQAELGGNNAAVIWPDCDLPDAARRIAEGAFGMAGQRCTANRRAIVHRDCYDEFLDLLTRATAELPWGDPLDERTRVGPLVSAAQAARVAALIERASKELGPAIVPHGASALHLFGPGFGDAFYPPTTVCCDDPGHEIVQEETFGPVLVVQKAADWEQAMQLCNGVRQGLAAAIFTRSQELQRQFLEGAQAGVLKVNQSTADAAVDMPFGGWKASGIGPPEHGAGDREFYTRLQAVYYPRR